MKKLPTIIYFVIALMSIGLALDEDEISEANGLRFDSNQTVEGFGIASSYRYMAPSDLVLHSHSSGSGVFTIESKDHVRNDVIVQGSPESFATNISVGLQENANKAFAPKRIDYPGSFRSEPISTLWSESTFAGTDGIILKACFDQAQALNKEMTTKVSGTGDYEKLTNLKSSVTFGAVMDINASFNGTGQIGAYVGPTTKKNPETLVDEYYKGIFTITKKMDMAIKTSLQQDEDDWLPCCSGGLDDMNDKDKESFPDDFNRVFNCTCT